MSCHSNNGNDLKSDLLFSSELVLFCIIKFTVLSYKLKISTWILKLLTQPCSKGTLTGGLLCYLVNWRIHGRTHEIPYFSFNYKKIILDSFLRLSLRYCWCCLHVHVIFFSTCMLNFMHHSPFHAIITHFVGIGWIIGKSGQTPYSLLYSQCVDCRCNVIWGNDEKIPRRKETFCRSVSFPEKNA